MFHDILTCTSHTHTNLVRMTAARSQSNTTWSPRLVVYVDRTLDSLRWVADRGTHRGKHTRTQCHKESQTLTDEGGEITHKGIAP